MANKKPLIYFILNYAIALIWLLNGLFCKLLNFVPRHQQIVGRILGDEYSFVLIKLFGVSEVLMCIWIMSRNAAPPLRRFANNNHTYYEYNRIANDPGSFIIWTL